MMSEAASDRRAEGNVPGHFYHILKKLTFSQLQLRPDIAVIIRETCLPKGSLKKEKQSARM
jgi:hypothetical protein